MACDRKPFTAVFFILLLAGSECHRIDALRSSQTAERSVYVRARKTKANGENAKFSFNSDVCRSVDFENSSVAVTRYESKVAQLRSVSAHLSEKPNSGLGWFGLVSRVKKFKSCMHFLDQEGKKPVRETVPQELIDIMSNGPDSLPGVMLAPKDALSQLFREYDTFPRFSDLPGCHFGPEGISVEKLKQSDAPDDTMHKQLFGESCSSAQTDQYISRLNGTSNLVARVMKARMVKMKVYRQKLTNLMHEKEAGTADSQHESVLAETLESMINIAKSSAQDLAPVEQELEQTEEDLGIEDDDIFPTTQVVDEEKADEDSPVESFLEESDSLVEESDLFGGSFGDPKTKGGKGRGGKGRTASVAAAPAPAPRSATKSSGAKKKADKNKKTKKSGRKTSRGSGMSSGMSSGRSNGRSTGRIQSGRPHSGIAPEEEEMDDAPLSLPPAFVLPPIPTKKSKGVKGTGGILGLLKNGLGLLLLALILIALLVIGMSAVAAIVLPAGSVITFAPFGAAIWSTQGGLLLR